MKECGLLGLESGLCSTLVSRDRVFVITIFPAAGEMVLTCWPQPERKGTAKLGCRSVGGITGWGGGGRQMKVQHQSFSLLFFFN